MVAPAYADARRDMAKRNGLGRKRKQEGGSVQASPEQGGAEQAPSPRRGRRPKSSSAERCGQVRGPRLPTACPVRMSAGAASPDVCHSDDATDETFGLEL